MKVYQVCVLSTLRQRDLDPQIQPRALTHHLPPALPQKDIGITWQDRVRNKDVQAQAGAPSVFALLSQRRLRWLGHASRMEDGRIPKDILLASLPLELELQEALRFISKMFVNEILKQEISTLQVWEAVAADRSLETFGQGTQA